MAKDVDLQSKEWRDLVFEGKNQEYGAYEMRKTSARRHNVAMIAVVVILAILAALAILVNTVIAKVEAKPEDENEQMLVDLSDAQETPEEEEPVFVKPEEEVALPEEVLNTVKMTEIKFVEDNLVKEPPKSQDEFKETETAVGNTTFDQGTDEWKEDIKEKKADLKVTEAPVIKEQPKPVEENKVFTHVEQMPAYPGGDAALLQYLSSHIRYPQDAADDGIEGQVVVRFVVTKTGKVGEVQVLRGKHPSLDREATRVVKTLPAFTPGKMNGNTVNVWYTLPVRFKLAK